MVNALNLADFLLTMNVLSHGGGEANPIMRSLFAMDPLYAGIFKMVAVFFTSWLTWRCRRFRSGLQVAHHPSGPLHRGDRATTSSGWWLF